jgi:peptide chain release factor 2
LAFKTLICIFDYVVKDLRTDTETSNVQGVMDGDLDEFIKAYLMEMSKN